MRGESSKLSRATISARGVQTLGLTFKNFSIFGTEPPETSTVQGIEPPGAILRPNFRKMAENKEKAEKIFEACKQAGYHL